MNDRRGAAFLLLLLTIYQEYHSAHCTPILVIPEGVVVVNEKETRMMPLNILPITCSDVDGHHTRVYWKSTNPDTGCGKCFQVWPIANKSNEYDLEFIPTFGVLKFVSQSSYLVVLGCSDDVDAEETTGIIEVRINPNTPPYFIAPNSSYFSPPDISVKNKTLDYTIFDVNATDNDDDAIFYYMSQNPATGLFDIGYANGKITAKKHLNMSCDPSVDFYVTAWDSYNSPVGPVIIDSKFTSTNTPPQVPSDVTIHIKENKTTDIYIPVDVYVLNTNDSSVFPQLYYTMKATPERGLEYYYLNQSEGKTTIKTRINIDYEYLELRTVTLTIDVTDGYCKGPSQQVTVHITDINEAPSVYPQTRVVTVYEGFINVDPQFNLIDPDENEKHKWSVTSTNQTMPKQKQMKRVKLDVDTDTGQIFSVGESSLEPDVEEATFVMTLQVVDKDNALGTPVPTVTVIVRDKNDNTPKFNASKYDYFANPCTPVGTVLNLIQRKIIAIDDDSAFQGNNQLVYGGRSRNMSVMATGDVILTQPCEPVGAVDSLLATVTDQGLYPGPLVGIPVAVTLTCNPCPTPTPAPITGTGKRTTLATGTGGRPGTGTDTGNAANFFDANLGWLVPAILLGCTLLGLLAYLLWRYCSRACARWKAARALRQKSAQLKPSKPKPPKEKKKKLQKPPPPAPPAPEPEPFLFGFWKETYPDRDQRHMPMREIKPASVEADKRVEEKEKKEEAEEKKKREMERQKELDRYRKEMEEYHKKVDAINKANNSGDPPPPKKRCTIL